MVTSEIIRILTKCRWNHFLISPVYHLFMSWVTIMLIVSFHLFAYRKLQVLKSLKHTLNIQNFPNFLLKYPLESLLIKFVLFGVFRYSLLSLNALTSSFVLSLNLDAIWYKRKIVLAILPQFHMWIQRWNFAQEFRSNLSPMILFSLSYACSLFRFLILTWKKLSGKTILSGLPSASRHFCWKKIWLIFQWHIVGSASKWSNNCYLSFCKRVVPESMHSFLLSA